MFRSAVWVPLLILAGCTTVPEWMAETPPPLTPTELPDGPPLITSIDVETIPEPKPLPEPLSAYGNPATYVINGVTYKVESVKVGFSEHGIASWYGRKFHGRLTSSGEPFDMFKFTAAHKTMPIPAWVRVTNLSNDLSLVVRVNDRGPFKRDRVLDVSWATAKRLQFDKQGITAVRYEVLEIPKKGTTLKANPLVDSAQQIFQVTAVSTKLQAAKVVEELSEQLNERDASIRIEPNGRGLFRVQVLPRTDEEIMTEIYKRLVNLGWSPQRLIVR